MLNYIKSSYSTPAGHCVQVAADPLGNVFVRDSKDPDCPPQMYTHAEWVAFVAGVKSGEFDHAWLLAQARNAYSVI